MIVDERWATLAPWRSQADFGGLAGPVVVGCSGGADSTALLALAVDAGLAPIAVHVDHGLRPGSEQEATVVADLAAAWGASFVARRVEIGPGAGLEARARDARHRALAAVAREHGATAVLIGHTMDDLAETVLLNVLRGAATAGLAGIASPRPGVRHPLLGLRRSETVEICARLGIAPLVDPMNEVRAFRRVWVRRELLPMLRAGAARDVVPVLARQAAVLRDESAYLDGLARAAWPGPDGPRAGGLLALDPVLARRAVRAWLGAPPVPAAGIDAVLALAAAARGPVELPGGRRVTRSGGLLSVHPSTVAVPVPEQLWAVPGTVAVAEACLVARVERGAPVGWPDGASVCVLDADVAGARLRVRAPHPGERIAVRGGGTRPVGTLLAQAGVAPGRRAAVPVVADEATDTALWIPGVRAGRTAAVGPTTHRYLWLELAAPAG